MRSHYPKRKLRWRLTRYVFAGIVFVSLIIILLVPVDTGLKFAIEMWTIIAVVAGIISQMAADKVKNYSKGESGELKVKGTLQQLPSLYSYRGIVIDDSNWDIDFVVVAKSGVYVLEVKDYDTKLKADGDIWYGFREDGTRYILPNSFSKQVKSNARQLQRYIAEKNPHIALSFCKPVVVLTQPFIQSDIKTKVLVTSPEGLSDILKGADELTKEQMDSLTMLLGQMGEDISI